MFLQIQPSCQAVLLAIKLSNTAKLGFTIISPLLFGFSRLLPGDTVAQSDSVWTFQTYSHNLGVFGRRTVQGCKCSLDLRKNSLQANLVSKGN